MLSAKDETIKEKDIRIAELERDLRRYYANEVRFDQITEEIKINYQDLKSISFAREFSSDFEKMDTLNIVTVEWKMKVNKRNQRLQEDRLKTWLEKRLRLKNITIRKK